jgi:DNA-directed RNA polymerase I subunit RPA2
MEDASILSKGAFERGYGYGTVLKGEWVDLSQYRRKGEPISHRFGFRKAGTNDPINLPEKKLENALKFLDEDGLPMIGVRLSQGDPYYAYFDEVTEKVHVQAYKGMEDAYVDQVRLLGTDEGVSELQKVHIKLRIPRPPIIGDKFSSRHGQKGVISQKWPSVDMPFSETGIIPDVIINPHAFPSRMTIGMFVESIAGKSGALHGHAQDATPFQFNEQNVPQEHFGNELLAAGFNYHGNEAMYSGITGQEFKADIYIGVFLMTRLCITKDCVTWFQTSTKSEPQGQWIF